MFIVNDIDVNRMTTGLLGNMRKHVGEEAQNFEKDLDVFEPRGSSATSVFWWIKARILRRFVVDELKQIIV